MINFASHTNFLVLIYKIKSSYLSAVADEGYTGLVANGEILGKYLL